jgi:hypothetical protein
MSATAQPELPAVSVILTDVMLRSGYVVPLTMIRVVVTETSLSL